MAEEPRRGIFNLISDPDTTSIEQPETGKARVVPGLPLRLLLVSDFVPGGEVGAPRSVDKNSLATLMQAWKPRLALEVPNTISDAPKTLELELGFSDFEAFSPVQVVEQVPPLAQLLHIRTLVEGVRQGNIDPDDFRERLAETGVDADWASQLYQALTRPPSQKTAPSASMGPSGNETLDRLFGMVSLGGEEEEEAQPAPPPKSEASSSSALVGALMDAVAGAASSKPKVEKTAAAQLVADLDAVISEQLNAIMNHPAFRRLEGSWRGLKLLVDRLNFRKNVQLEVLASPKDEIDNRLYQQVLLAEHQEGLEKPPLSAVILDYAFDRSAADLVHLAELAATGASLQTPLIGAVDPAFFGIAQHAGLSRLPVLWQQLDSPEYIEWHKLRKQKEASFLALALPAFLLRPPYGPDYPAEGLTFTEEGHLWGNASLAVALRVAASFAETEWPTHLEGERDREVGNLPFWKSQEGATPLATLIPDSKFGELKKAGFTVLGGRPNKDHLYVARAVTVCEPETYEDLMAAAEAREHVTLACQLFVARAAHYVLALQDDIQAGDDAEALKQEVFARLRSFFNTPGQTVPPDTVIVQHVEDAGLPQHELLALRLNPPSYVLDRSVSLVMGMQVPKAASA